MFRFVAVSVVIIFFICYAPYHGQRLMYAYGTHMGWTHSLRALNEELFYIAGKYSIVHCQPVAADCLRIS